MGKRKSKKTKKTTRHEPRARPERIASLDTVRGFAIVLMIIDHVALLFFDVLIQPDTVRFWTRLSMPLFCMLMGYFLSSKSEVNWSRIGQILLAACIVNLAYYTRFGQLEILASLLVCYVVYALLGRWFVLLILGVFLFQVDPSRIQVQPTRELFDYPITVVAAIVATGMALKLYGHYAGILAAAGLLLGTLCVPAPTMYVLWFAPLALSLVILGSKYPKLHVPVIATFGRYPLTAYVTQYLVLFMLAS